MTTLERPLVTPTTTGRVLIDVDPTTLLVDVNARHDARVDDDFCASIAEHGVLVPVVAVRTADGGLRVRYGHCRSMAAVRVGRDVVRSTSWPSRHATARPPWNGWSRSGRRTRTGPGGATPSGSTLSASCRRSGSARPRSLAAPAPAGPRSPSPPWPSPPSSWRARRPPASSSSTSPRPLRWPGSTPTPTPSRRWWSPPAMAGSTTSPRDCATSAPPPPTAHRATAADKLRETGVRVLDTPTTADPALPVHRLVNADGTRPTVEEHQECPAHAAYIADRYGWVDPEGQPVSDDQDEDDEDSDEDDDERRLGERGSGGVG